MAEGRTIRDYLTTPTNSRYANVDLSDLAQGFRKLDEALGIDLFSKSIRETFPKKVDDAVSQVLQMDIKEEITFYNRNYIINYELMKSLMDLNIKYSQETILNIGKDSHLDGDSRAITGDALRPSYAKGMNYVENYVTKIDINDRSGVNTTQAKGIERYDSPYVEETNLYPDDLDSGVGNNFNKWRLDGNPNSILLKTKKLFAAKRINTLISRFATEGENGSTSVSRSGDSITYMYGMSHGRNLLKKGAEEMGGTYYVNGYNNPYCRVWTHHYQYDRLSKLIRPFENKRNLEELHTWKGFENEFDGEVDKTSWKAGNTGWNKSVLDENGFVKITPKYLGGGKLNVHTKDCMFSIENLAWRGYDPYSFEQALSWEQRGPLGGRIMWFPPYGLTFNETTSAKWTPNTFIGRGEDVYTYVNTERTGTLSFMMLTDHPSSVDYANWYDSTGGLKDTDLLRYFAGCGDLDEFIKPTPLTDEYINATKDITHQTTIDLRKKGQNNVSEEEKNDLIFYAFFPNNYSGVYDAPTNEGSVVNAIEYLLAGDGAQQDGKSKKDERVDLSNGVGYEIVDSGISVFPYNKFITGSKKRWNEYGSGEGYQDKEDRRFYYRVDGEYKIPQKADWNKNTYDQKLPCPDGNFNCKDSDNSNYKDTLSFQLNSKIDNIKKNITSEEENKSLYSLLEVAAIIMDLPAGLKDMCDQERLDDLKKIIDDIKDNSSEYTCNITGYSNSNGKHTNEEVNDDRNKKLAIQRADTLNKWLVKNKINVKTTIDSSDSIPINDITNEYNHSALKPKLWRSAKVVFKRELGKTISLNETNGEQDNSVTVTNGYSGFKTIEDYNKEGYNIEMLPKGENEVEIVYTKDGEIYRELKPGVLVNTKVVGQEADMNPDNAKLRYQLDLSSATNEYGRRLLFYKQSSKDNDQSQMNVLRYDQEYYFYKKMEKENPLVFKKLTEKLKYFDPAFHSMTPEGFNERLTFLNQCTRQGNTITPSEKNNPTKTASNLGFGRPPFCVLRIGDFYYQTIVIESINFDFNASGGLQWDLNPEGAGVQPMLATININFKFIGGGDLGGPIRRLQNAMTFNYYANARLYDNRADRISYNWDDKTNGALDYGVDTNNSYAYTTEMSK